ncbi:MAG: phosphate acyltransferase [Thermosediminibacterales bacterium]|nr:phosphate acyltransferase [Thermosediminibacterales bacterium]MDK2835451.1 phosphate acyltransferase [Thermosediminibacterales bacterium]
MKIAVDAMGGDLAPEEIVKGVAACIKDFDGEIFLVGEKSKIEFFLRKYDAANSEKIKVVEASETITNEDQPVKAIKTKKDSSMVKGIRMLKKREVDAFLSAGNTGAFMAGALLLAGRIQGIDRPALAVVIPTRRGATLMLDVGANMNSKPTNLVQFAIMGSVYSNKVLGIKNPKVGLLNVGEESQKGNILTKETYKLLQNNETLNFWGNIEGRNILDGKVDVLVCDGFIGNIVLKTIEGFAINFFDLLKNEIMSSISTKIGGMLLKPSLKKLKGKLDYTEYGGAPFLGIDGICIKCHGSSNAKAISNAILKTELFIKNNVNTEIFQEIQKKGEN